jgi:hypothetical protein
MNDHACQHKILDGVTVARCEPHSTTIAGLEVWMWSTRMLPPLCCSCLVADRFVVVTGMSDAALADSADVMVCAPESTVAAALNVAGALFNRMRGCTLMVVPIGNCEIMFRTRSDTRVVGLEDIMWPLCEICLYPWLAAGHRLAELS